MSPENAARQPAQRAGLTPENAELLARYAGHLERSPLIGHSPRTYLGAIRAYQRNAAYPIQMRSKIRISSALSSKWKVSRPHPPGAEHGPAVCRIIAGWHYDCVPGRLYQFHDSVQQRVESLAGQAVELD